MRLARNSLIPSINHHRLLAFLFSINRCCFLIRQLVNSTRESYSVNPGTSVKLFLLERYRKIIEKKYTEPKEETIIGLCLIFVRDENVEVKGSIK